MILPLAALIVSGCHDKAPAGEATSAKSIRNALTESNASSPSGLSAAASTAGPSCTTSGDPTVGVNIGFNCTGALAAATFTHALCACNTIQDSNSLTTDGFDSTAGGPNGGLGGDVAANAGISWSTTSTIGGTVWTPGSLTSSNPSTVRGDLHLGGSLSGSGTFTVNGNAFVVKTLPAFAKVLGKINKVTSVASPCSCSNPVPTVSITAAHRAPNNDDSTINLSPTGYVGNNPTTLDLPCGNYYLTAINAAQPLTIKVHGHSALYVDGDLQASQTLAVQTDVGATLDLFVAGTFSAAQSLALGSSSHPENCRLYVAGTSFVTSGSTAFGCNVYAPNALVTLANNAVVSGSVFAGSVQVSGNATVHYDTSILGAGGECCSATSCDDGNPCTVDSCNGNGTCTHASAANGSVCSDGNSCTQTDTCQAGVCTGANPVVCKASDQCHLAGTCNPANGTCTNPVATNGTACSDGNGCTRTDTCQAGVCSGSNPVVCTAADQCHLPGTCNAQTGTCSNPVVSNGTSCSDGNSCTRIDTCQAGVCTGSSPVVCAASDQCHVAGTCDPVSGACSNPPAADGVACSDGNSCTRTDTCQSGTCTGANPVACSASDQCHLAGTCDTQTGSCTNPAAANGSACNDGNACTRTDSCQSGICAGSNPVVCTAGDQCHVPGTCDSTNGTCSNPIANVGKSCSDGNACNGAETCDSTGKCTSGAAPVVDDGNPCTADSCDPQTGVGHAPVAAGTSCSDGNVCNGAEVCDSTGKCTAGSTLPVDDGNPCTVDACDPQTGATHTFASAGTACLDGDVCNGRESCDGTGHCSLGVPLVLDDSNPCTADHCDPIAGVTHSPLAAGSSCDDGNACNGLELCDASAHCLSGIPPTVDDKNPCTSDSCDKATGVSHLPMPVGASCSDGNVCNGQETCDSAGNCANGAPLPLDDNEPCTSDSCDPATGVHHTPVAAGTSCADGNSCNGAEFCDGAGRCTTGTAVATDDGNPCTTDTCDPASGVLHTPVVDGLSCDDADLCNGREVCRAGTCSSGAPPVVDDGNPCTADSCSAATGVVHTPQAGQSCDDGNLCNGLATCSAGGQCLPGTAPTLDDDNPCTIDTCDPHAGVSHSLAPVGISCGAGDVCSGFKACDALGQCTPSNPPNLDDGNPCTLDRCDPLIGVVHEPVAAGATCPDDGNVCDGPEFCDGAGHCASGPPLPIDDHNACTTDSCDPQRGALHAPVILASDGDPCTTETCDPVNGLVQHLAAIGTSCAESGNSCDTAICDVAGVCVKRTVPGSDDGNPCTLDICDPSTAAVTHTLLPVGSACETAAGLCAPRGVCTAQGECKQAAPAALIDDQNPCTLDVCDPATGVVQHTPQAQGTACDDLDFCDGPDACDGAGRCIALGSPIIAADDGNPCTLDLCDAKLGVSHVPGEPGVSCGIGLFCSADGACKPSIPDPCVTYCQHKATLTGANYTSCSQQCALDSSGPCSPQGTDYVKCANANQLAGVADPPQCADKGSALTQCQTMCQATVGSPTVSPYLGDCAEYTCSLQTGLATTFKPEGTSCQPSNDCDYPGQCDGAGRCRSSGTKPLEAICLGDTSTAFGRGQGPGFCYNGGCFSTTSETNPCFNTAVGVALAVGTPCSLGPCSTPGVCDHRGLCVSTPAAENTNCDDGNLCNGIMLCDASWRCFKALPAINPADTNPCTDDLCDPATGAVSHPLRPAASSCDDGLACDGKAEACDALGSCKPTTLPATVDDNNPCTIDACNEPGGNVTHTRVADNTPCSDGNVCNGLELCKSGVCKPGTAIIIPNDGNLCTTKTCDSVKGLIITPIPAGSSCSNGNACDGAETCDGQGACLAGVPPSIDDHDACTVDACDPSGGVSHTTSWPDDGNPCTTAVACDPVTGSVQQPSPPGTDCSDRNPCNGTKVCDANGSCVASQLPTIDDGNPCTVDSCDSYFGPQHVPTAGGTSCSDGNECNGREICDGHGACLAGVALPLDDGQPCTIDSCDPVQGVKHTWSGDPSCNVQRPSWENLASSAPSPRDSAAGAFADVTSEVIIVTGNNGGAVLADTWLFNTTTGRWRQSYAVGPAARAGASVTYDSVRKRVLLFGGLTGADAGARYLSDVWEYDPLGDTWVQRSDGRGAAPSARAYAAFAFDSQRARAVLFGGVGSSNFGDTWELDPASGSWTLQASGGPAPRAGAAIGYDSSTGHFTLFGGAPHTGTSPGTPFGDTWDLDPEHAAWTQQTTTGAPSARTAHALTFDSNAHVFRLFGGTGPERTALGDFWQYTPSTREWMALAAGPPARAGQILAYSAQRQSTFLGMGLSYSASGLFTPQFSDMWEYGTSSGAWSDRASDAPFGLYPGIAYDGQRRKLVTLGRAPAIHRDLLWEYDDQSSRWQASDVVFAGGRVAAPFTNGPAFYDAARGVVLAEANVFGLGDSSPTLAISEWDGHVWRTDCSMKWSLTGSSVAFDPVRSKLLVLFGSNPRSYWQPSSWSYQEIDPVTCAVRTVLASGQLWPAGRERASVAWDSQRDRVVVFGGQLYNGTWALTPSTQQWKQLASNGVAPPTPSDNTMTYDPTRDRFVLLTKTGDTWELDGASGLWSQLGTGNGPIIAASPIGDRVSSMTFDGLRASVVAVDADANLWDWSAGHWQKRETNTAPSARSGAAGGWSSADQLAVFFGGLSGDGRRTLLGDTWVWKGGWHLVSSPDANQSPSSFAPAPNFLPATQVGYSPSPRTGHAFSVGSQGRSGISRGVLFGGETDATVLGDTWIWLTERLSWIPAATPVSPSARTGHAMANIPGLGVLLFGGKKPDGSLADTLDWVFAFNSDYDGFWFNPPLRGDTSPPPRWGHAMVTDPVRKKVIMFGGRDNSSALGDMWEFDPTTTPVWTRRAPLQSPPARFGHQLTYDEARSRIILTGGSGDAPDGAYDDTWEWDELGNTWRARDPERKLPPRVGHVAFYDGAQKQVTVFGGLQYQTQATTTFAYGDTVAFARASSSGDAGARFPVGSGCAGNSDCATGVCADGFCCNATCDGQCAACNLPGKEGQCTPVVGPPANGRPACTDAQDECGQCGGIDLTACGRRDGTACSKDGCFFGQFERSGQCYGNTCTGGSISCAPYGCDQYGCVNRCFQDADCYSQLYFCSASTCHKHAEITTVTVDPPQPAFGALVTVSASATPSGGNEPAVQFRFSVTGDDGQPDYPCGATFASANSCTWSPRRPGQYFWHVEALTSGSTRIPYDDVRNFFISVGAP